MIKFIFLATLLKTRHNRMSIFKMPPVTKPSPVKILPTKLLELENYSSVRIQTFYSGQLSKTKWANSVKPLRNGDQFFSFLFLLDFLTETTFEKIHLPIELAWKAVTKHCMGCSPKVSDYVECCIISPEWKLVVKETITYI